MQMLANDVIQELRVKHHGHAVDLENRKIKQTHNTGENYRSETLGNRDPVKQLLARSRGGYLNPLIPDLSISI